MPASTGLSDDQVAGELTKMVEFIKKEAEEKAKEIRIKANEEYEIEKASIVRAETASIDQDFESRYKQAKMDQQIVKSTVANKTRLNVLGAKEEVLDDVFEEAKKQLADISKDASKYESLLVGLIEEGVRVLKESKVFVRARASDKDVVNKAIEKAKGNTKGVEIALDDSTLDKQSFGGAIVLNGDKKIWIDNSLDERLKLVYEGALPRIRFDLFGPSATRTFFD